MHVSKDDVAVVLAALEWIANAYEEEYGYGVDERDAAQVAALMEQSLPVLGYLPGYEDAAGSDDTPFRAYKRLKQWVASP